MSQKSVTVVKSIVAAGYQLDKDCLELLRLIEDRVNLDRLAVEVVNEASKAKLWPPIVNRSLLEKVALTISPKEDLGLEVIRPMVSRQRFLTPRKCLHESKFRTVRGQT